MINLIISGLLIWRSHMRKSLISIMTTAAVAVSSLWIGGPALAVGPTGNYTSTLACSNLSSTTASISIGFFSQGNPTAVLDYPDTIGANTSKVYYLSSGTPSVPSGFQGSAVVSSDQQVACSAQLDNVASGAGTSGNPARVAIGQSFDINQVSTKLYGAQIANALGNSTVGFFYSYVAIQNIEQTPVNVTYGWVDRSGASGTWGPVTIPPQTNYITYTRSIAGLPAQMSAILTVSATGRVAGAVVSYNDGPANNGVVTPATSQLQQYNMVSAGGSKLFAPQYVRNYYGFQSGINIANIGTTTSTITTTYFINGSTFTSVSQLGANKVLGLFSANTPQLAPVDAFLESRRTGSVMVQGDPGSVLVGTVNQRNSGGSDCTVTCSSIGPQAAGGGSTIDAFVDGQQTNRLVMPRFVKNLGASSTFNAGLAIVNPGAADGTCDITYSGSAVVETAVPITRNGGTIGRYAGATTGLISGLPSGFENAVFINCTVPVFASGNLRGDNTSYLGDSQDSTNVYNYVP
jgi:hypothetical protein